jgi:hypothetical protein
MTALSVAIACLWHQVVGDEAGHRLNLSVSNGRLFGSDSTAASTQRRFLRQRSSQIGQQPDPPTGVVHVISRQRFRLLRAVHAAQEAVHHLRCRLPGHICIFPVHLLAVHPLLDDHCHFDDHNHHHNHRI